MHSNDCTLLNLRNLTLQLLLLVSNTKGLIKAHFTVAATEVRCPFVSSILQKYKLKHAQSVTIARNQQNKK
jgi:hypothetical protein